MTYSCVCPSSSGHQQGSSRIWGGASETAGRGWVVLCPLVSNLCPRNGQPYPMWTLDLRTEMESECDKSKKAESSMNFVILKFSKMFSISARWPRWPAHSGQGPGPHRHCLEGQPGWRGWAPGPALWGESSVAAGLDWLWEGSSAHPDLGNELPPGLGRGEYLLWAPLSPTPPAGLRFSEALQVLPAAGVEVPRVPGPVLGSRGARTGGCGLGVPEGGTQGLWTPELCALEPSSPVPGG